MAYNKTVWTDRIAQYPNRYTKQNETSTQVTLVADEGVVTSEGTFVNANLLNKIEDGVYSAHTTADSSLSIANTSLVTRNIYSYKNIGGTL